MYTANQIQIKQVLNKANIHYHIYTTLHTNVDTKY